MLADLKKYISDEIDTTPEEKFMKYILEHCMDESLKSILIDGIRGNAATLIYDNETFFNFFCGDQHMYDIFDYANSEYSILLEAYLKCIFKDSEFSIYSESADIAAISHYYLKPITRIKPMFRESFKEIKKAIIQFISSKDIEMLLQAAKTEGSYEFIYEYMMKCGFDEVFVESTEILIDDEFFHAQGMEELIKSLAECLGINLNEYGVMYYWNVNFNDFYNLEPDHDLIDLIDIAEKLRNQLGRTNIESSKPYMDLIISILGVHNSAKEVLF